MGIWVVIQMIPSYAEAFGRLKFDIAAVYFLGKRKYEIKEVLFTLNALALITSMIIIALVIFRVDWINIILFKNVQEDVSLYIYLIICTIPLQFFYMNYAYLFLHKEDIINYNRMIVIKALVGSIGAIILLLVFDMGLLAVIVASIVSGICSLAYGMAILNVGKTLNYNINILLIKDLLSYGFKLYIYGILGHLNSCLTQFVTVLYLSSPLVAFFSMAQGKGQLLDKIPNAINSILFPRISNMESNKDSGVLATKAFRVIFIALFMSGIIGVVLIYPAVNMLYGSAYIPLVKPFIIILPGIVLTGASSVLTQFFIGIGRADLNVKISIVPLCCQFLFAFILIPTFGLSGAALSLLLTMSISSVTIIAVFLKISRVKIIENLLPGKSDIAIIYHSITSIVKEYLFKTKYSFEFK